MTPLVISLCDFTGNAVRPWAEAGYRCWIVDIKHKEGINKKENNIYAIGMDITKFEPPEDRNIAFVFAFPPCTHMAVSGARWFKGKGLDALADSIRIVAACARICEQVKSSYLIENPVSTLATYWRKPDYIFDPCDYSGYLVNTVDEAYTKKTCLWVGNGFVMPPKKRVKPVYGSMIHTLPPTEDREEIRSATPQGFSKAIFEANHKNSKIAIVKK